MLEDAPDVSDSVSLKGDKIRQKSLHKLSCFYAPVVIEVLFECKMIANDLAYCNQLLTNLGELQPEIHLILGLEDKHAILKLQTESALRSQSIMKEILCDAQPVSHNGAK